VPLITESRFRPPWWLRNRHFQTTWPAIARRVRWPAPRRERLELADGDFIDLDWQEIGARRVVIIAHGLEGNSRRPYVRGLVRALNRAGWDAIAWNFRGCSGEMNRLPRYYHSGATEDLAAIVDHVSHVGRHDVLAVAGFSLGANLTLKFLGEGHPSAERVAAGFVVSVPCDLRSSAERMATADAAFYMRQFIPPIGAKWDAKRAVFPREIPATDWRSMKTFRELDDAFTAPVHGFRDALEYWQRCSSGRFLAGIRVPTLILNALDDPFLTEPCHPRAQAAASSHVHLELPAHGGHVGFADSLLAEQLWSERRGAEFLAAMAG
jgi:uncharacterized protein